MVYGIDTNYPDILYVPEDVHFDLHPQTVSWTVDGESSCIRLLPGKTYVRPSGYKVHMIKPPGARAWRLVGTVAEGTYGHKPCTVSGGGKSEISKPITEAILEGPVHVRDFKVDFDAVEKIIDRDFRGRFRAGRGKERGRKILSPERSLGSVIRLLTPSQEEYEGMELNDSKIRAMFDRKSLLESDWYRERLEAKCKIDRSLAQRHLRALESFLSKPAYSEEAARLGIAGRLTRAYRHRDATESEVYLQKLQGTLGVHPLTC